ncbi:MAG: DUF3179 domain-containing protein [Hoeflea sp.]|uniref:DUF3179 domain-containing protein n=1 Tax=Hoeflea sp. TaxID=1940281 RepID=UPI001DBE8B2A|nr:DUF3179 domain-containing protein [Hoeflea sp.]MBU4528390.1 DUF3179 domain-containing protein [Alphaproteobacteria bacterium]MBU4543059.1 DUF3179 domain-containing protein [Alphaproteobacteria bacterium]MBU4551750.1 DUF3179 domain-containing protein [Alphaproteobacteria bacterium]MBV1723645.1 DUF3179 domain-containing protein [Hoeflea sp.]MBV1761961.1 DUF3179 domain-containing protein [Hoeflea sp.]
MAGFNFPEPASAGLAERSGTVVITLLAALCLALSAISAAAEPDRWRAEGWTTDFSRSNIDFASIMSGGPPRDGIPPIDDPAFLPVSDAAGLDAKEPVMSVEIGGEVRAYPLRIMIWHEIVNDTLAGRPISVTYCPLCNAAIVFDRTVDGQETTFGTTGKLRNSDLVMYDRETESWWQQFTGEAITGSRTGARLEVIPSRLQSWQSFRDAHPDGEVLVPNNPGMRDYGRNPYAGYDSSAVPFLYRGPMPEGIAPLSYVVLVRDLPQPLAISLDKLRREGRFESDGIAIEWVPGVRSVLDTGDIESGREIGSVAVTRNGENHAHELTFAFVVRAFLPETTILK